MDGFACIFSPGFFDISFSPGPAVFWDFLVSITSTTYSQWPIFFWQEVKWKMEFGCHERCLFSKTWNWIGIRILAAKFNPSGLATNFGKWYCRGSTNKKIINQNFLGSWDTDIFQIISDETDFIRFWNWFWHICLWDVWCLALRPKFMSLTSTFISLFEKVNLTWPQDLWATATKDWEILSKKMQKQTEIHRKNWNQSVNSRGEGVRLLIAEIDCRNG